MAVDAKLWTAEDLEALEPSDDHYEIIQGELVQMPPAKGPHFGVIATLLAHLILHVVPRRLGVVGNEGGFRLARDPEVLVEPDIAFIRVDRVPANLKESSDYIDVVPELAVEVLSPTDRIGRVSAKVAAYLRAGVRLVWLVDSELQTVTVYSLSKRPVVLTIHDELDGGEVLAEFRMRVGEIFA